jgi:hypothetical protein
MSPDFFHRRGGRDEAGSADDLHFSVKIQGGVFGTRRRWVFDLKLKKLDLK